MAFQAIVRVVGVQGRWPTSTEVNKAAHLLSDLGFTVVHIGRLGVSVEGGKETFEDVLGVPPPGPEGYVRNVRPRDYSLSALVNQVEAIPRIESLS